MGKEKMRTWVWCERRGLWHGVRDLKGFPPEATSLLSNLYQVKMHQARQIGCHQCH